MGAKSRSNGAKGEMIAQKFFREHGYWVHLMGRSASGSQPVDLIAVKGIEKGNQVWLLDVKFVSSSKPSFGFDDIQPDQLTTFRYAREYAHLTNLGFLIVFERDLDNPRYLPYGEYLQKVDKGQKSMNMDYICKMEEILKCAER